MANKTRTMLLIKPEGTEQEVQLPSGSPGCLREMYRLIGNGCDTVQLVGLGHGHQMWCDENAKLVPNPAPVNWKATRLLALAGGLPGDHVLGNVLIQSRKNSKPLPELVSELIIIEQKAGATKVPGCTCNIHRTRRTNHLASCNLSKGGA